MQARYLGPLAALLVLGGCATSQDLVVLLPDKDGKVGKVLVQNSKGETVLDSAYAAARTSGGDVQRNTVSQGEVKEVFGTTLTAMPPRPISFTLYFESGTDEFTEQSRQEVKRVIAEMARRQAPEITVIGHTEQVGPDQTNDALSLQRAERVKSILVGMGIPPERILTAGRGRREPLVRTADGASEPRNRRVEISVR
jgi:outer membrane protein OmpA-like peptidoglycan-associated protein